MTAASTAAATSTALVTIALVIVAKIIVLGFIIDSIVLYPLNEVSVVEIRSDNSFLIRSLDIL